MIIAHSAPARHLPHHLTTLSPGQDIENEFLFESYTRTPADAGPAGTGPTGRPPRPGRLAKSRPPRAAPIVVPRPSQPARTGRLVPHRLTCHVPASPSCTGKVRLEPAAHRRH